MERKDEAARRIAGAYGDPASRNLLLQPVDGHDAEELEAEAAEIRALAGEDFYLLAYRVLDWNRELSPWDAPPVFGKEPFGSGAEETLKALLELRGDGDRRCFLGGYSLAGLFALWAACRTEAFAGIAAASPSLWFPGFSAYARERGLRCGRVYLSLGDREERAKNPVLAGVGDQLRAFHSWLEAAGTDCVLEWNPGNHFRDPGLRTARAFAWLLRREREK